MIYKLKIKEIRVREHLQQIDLAKRLKISKNYLSELEHNKYDIRLSLLLAISEALNVEPSDLYTRF